MSYKMEILPPKYEFKTVDTRTLAGFEEAEKLHEEGWELISNGFWSMQFQRPVKHNEKTDK